MARNGEMIIAGVDCEGCTYYKDNEDINHKIICKARDKQYYYGQCIICEEKENQGVI